MSEISRLDEKILVALSNATHSASEIARRVRAGRTTVAYRLSRLQQHGYVHPVGKGKKNAVLWSITLQKGRNNRKVCIYEGSEFHKIYNEVFNLPKESIVYCAQGLSALHQAFLRVPRSKILAVHKTYKRKRSIIKG